MKQKVLHAASEYQQKGLSVIPVRPDKKPYVKWEKYQSERAEPDQITEWWDRWPEANVAIVTGAISKVTVVDIDTQQGHEAVNELIPDSLITPVARSQKDGWHYYLKHQDGVGCATRFLIDTDLRGDRGYIIAPPSIGEVGTYRWMPGLSIKDVDPQPMPKPLLNIINTSLYRGGGKSQEDINHTKSQIVTDSHIRFEEGNRDNALFALANHLVKGGMSEDNILKYMLFFGSNCTPPFPEKEILAKIQSALKRTKRRKLSIAEDLRKWVLVTEGHFLVTEYHAESQIVTSEDKHAAIVALSRLEKEGIVEKYGKKRGCYRKIEEAPSIDFLNASDTPFEIRWPFALEEYALIHPKNIIIIAGTQNSGKTAFVLNVTQMNMTRYRGRMRYVSSEMGGSELKGRLKKFNLPLEDWERAVDFREKSSNFSDIIMPDGLNIVDFYEISDKFWLIADDLKRIYDKLNKGIAIVCLQKSPGKSEGRGGDFGLEKPRLYLNLDPDPPDGAVLTIRKAKAWATEGKNPNWYKTRFKIVNGSKLIQQGGWYLEMR